MHIFLLISHSVLNLCLSIFHSAHNLCMSVAFWGCNVACLFAYFSLCTQLVRVCCVRIARNLCMSFFFIFHSAKSVFGLYTQIFNYIVKTTSRITSCNYGKFTRWLGWSLLCWNSGFAFGLASLWLAPINQSINQTSITQSLEQSMINQSF